MKILVVGGGGREHAIIKKLRESSGAEEIFCAPGNGGISTDATCVDIKATDIGALVDFAVREKIGLVVVATEAPLCLGLVDALTERGIPAFGPTKAAAEIEGSKVFAKELMRKYAIPTAEYSAFDDPAEAILYLKAYTQWPAVIKADGLALGKGVVIAQDIVQGEEAIRQMMEDKVFGESGSRVVVEEFLTGPEVSVLALCDGDTVIPMVSAKDHKRAHDGDKGPNTGGMGTIAPNPHYTPETAEQCMKEIFLPTIKAMKAEGRPFKGCLFFGLMITPKGPRVIEYNCRFGDPETQVVLPLLDADLLELMLAVSSGGLADAVVGQKSGAAACVALASGGYPEAYRTGIPIEGLGADGQPTKPGAVVYHAGTRKAQDGFVTAGGRVLGVTATGETLSQALNAAYAAAKDISFDGMHYRKDIGVENRN